MLALGLLLSVLLRESYNLLAHYMWSRPTHFACERAVYTVRTISYYPLIQHIENFITPKEIEHLKQVA